MRENKKANESRRAPEMPVHPSANVEASNETYQVILGKLTERIKELNCLYGISKLVESASSVDEILSGAVELIPKAWQYPEITCARIHLEDRQFVSIGFAESRWRQTERIVVDGQARGSIEVFYLEDKPQLNEGPFLTEERDLIHAIAERLGHILSRVEADARLESLYTSEKNLRHELQEQMHNRIEFTRRLIHELKTPLTSLLATSQLLSEELSDHSLGKLSSYVFENAARVNDRVDELHDIIKGEIGRPDVELKQVRLADILRAVLEEVGSLARQSELALELFIDEEDILVQADASRVRQILFNLLNNAFKYASGTGTVEMRTAAGKEKVTVQVRDNGPGIAEDEQKRIFEPYYRSPDKAKSSHGLGIGLALCKVLVTAQGGNIWVESRHGEGTSFYFTLKKAVEG
jgi:signal transduction histidine kinase